MAIGNFINNIQNVMYALTDCPHIPQIIGEKSKSRILMKLGWIDQLMGGIDHAQYFLPRVTLTGLAGPP